MNRVHQPRTLLVLGHNVGMLDSVLRHRISRDLVNIQTTSPDSCERIWASPLKAVSVLLNLRKNWGQITQSLAGFDVARNRFRFFSTTILASQHR